MTTPSSWSVASLSVCLTVQVPHRHHCPMPGLQVMSCRVLPALLQLVSCIRMASWLNSLTEHTTTPGSHFWPIRVAIQEDTDFLPLSESLSSHPQPDFHLLHSLTSREIPPPQQLLVTQDHREGAQLHAEMSPVWGFNGPCAHRSLSLRPTARLGSSSAPLG